MTTGRASELVNLRGKNNKKIEKLEEELRDLTQANVDIDNELLKGIRENGMNAIILGGIVVIPGDSKNIVEYLKR